MKRIVVIVMFLVSLCYAEDLSLAQMLAMRFGASAKFIVSVVNDDGISISNANVFCGFSQRDNKLGGADVSALTDDSGRCIVSGRTDGHEVVFRVEKEGYYRSRNSVRLTMQNEIHDVRFDCWQPYGDNLAILVRERRNPLSVNDVKDGKPYEHAIPQEDSWYGFDLMVGDWISPFGKGTVADLNVRIRSDVLGSMRNKGIEMDVEIVGADNGCYYENLRPNSEFKFSYVADVENAYKNEILNFHRYRLKGGFYDEVDPIKGREMVARIRTRKDAEGKVVFCHYVRILGVGMARTFTNETTFSIDYRLNLTPNDPNLETL